MSGDITNSISEPDARRLTERIRMLVGSVSDQLDKLAGLVAQARETSAHLALGYRSWTEYVAAEFADHPLRLDRDDRRQLVSSLAAEGMSTRAIAPVVGVHHDTVATDLAAVGNPTPGVTGTDGKTYARPAPDDRHQRAVDTYPVLAEYPDERAVQLATALDEYDDDERQVRLDALHKHAAARREGRLPTPTNDDTTGTEFFTLVNKAARLIEGKAERVAATTDPIERETWAAQFRRFAATCTDLADALEPLPLRSVQ